MQCKACGKDGEERDGACLHCGAGSAEPQALLRLVSDSDADRAIGIPESALRPVPGWQRAVMSAQKTLPGHLFPVPDLPQARIPVARPHATVSVQDSFVPRQNTALPASPTAPPLAQRRNGADGPPPAGAEPEGAEAGVAEVSPAAGPHAGLQVDATDRSAAPRRSGLPMVVTALAIVVAGIALLWWLAALRALDAGARPSAIASTAPGPAAIPDSSTPVSAASAAPAALTVASQPGRSAFSPAHTIDTPAGSAPAAGSDAVVALSIPPAPRPRNTAARARADKDLNRKAADESLGKAGPAAQRAEPPKSLDDLLK
jgi:hypothetical protein